MIRVFTIAALLLAPPAVSDLLQETLDSGRAITVAESPSDRTAAETLVAPGAPPVLSFRYFDAADRGRFGNLGLMTDDAGH